MTTDTGDGLHAELTTTRAELARVRSTLDAQVAYTKSVEAKLFQRSPVVHAAQVWRHAPGGQGETRGEADALAAAVDEYERNNQ